ncbi:ThiF family adenylyltransferase [Malikia spinosa]|uniref:ThiF family adenylyltransferase n=1 Tax=Malikia spinosa TaxID=86180 RepID=UPI0032372129
MPEQAVALTPFARAAAAIEAWLDGTGAAFATRTRLPDPRRKVASWDLELQHAVHGSQRASIYLTPDFPATPPQVRFDRSLCLVLPHIEEDGRFCHGIESAPRDFDEPVEAMVEVLKRLEKFWSDSADPVWIAAEFQRESLSYWLRFCMQYKPVRGAPRLADLRVALTELKGPTQGRFAAYFKKDQKARSELTIASVGEADPHGLAVRHGWAVGTLVRGDALFVPLDADQNWSPQAWPRTLHELEYLVASVTDNVQSVSKWVEDNKADARYFLVVLVQGKACYGYLVYPAPVAQLTSPVIVPVPVERVDPDWTLARDHGLGALHQRRKKRVLLLGCGSLGAPVAELLARAGVGELHLLDKEFFGSENCARHLLGASNIGDLKSKDLAIRLRKLVPGIVVKAHHALATDWIRHQCKPGTYDLVVDCTGESTVRTVLSRLREHSLGDCLVAHAWMEPFCAASHVVLLQHGNEWPADDPRGKVNVASWPEDTRVQLPACNTGFHPYGASDVWQAAGFTSERLLAALDGKVASSVVCSWVRSAGFFQTLGVAVQLGPLVPPSDSGFDAVQLTRAYKDVFGNE